MVFEPLLLPGGGATEMCVAQELARCGPLEMVGVQRWPFVAMGKALEVEMRACVHMCGVEWCDVWWEICHLVCAVDAEFPESH